MTPGDSEHSDSDVKADDVEEDPHVASSRADGDGGGSYVGRTAADDDFDAGESGAEARGRHRKPD